MCSLTASPESAVLQKAAALGAALPDVRLHQAPELFAGWADRIARADSLRHAGGDPAVVAAAVEEANRHIGKPTRCRLVPLPPPVGPSTAAPSSAAPSCADSSCLDRLAAALAGAASSPASPEAC